MFLRHKLKMYFCCLFLFYSHVHFIQYFRCRVKTSDKCSINMWLFLNRLIHSSLCFISVFWVFCTRLCCASILWCPPPCSAALLFLSILSCTDSWPELLRCVFCKGLQPENAAQLWETWVKVFKEHFRLFKIPPPLRISVYAAILILTSRNSSETRPLPRTDKHCACVKPLEQVEPICAEDGV